MENVIAQKNALELSASLVLPLATPTLVKTMDPVHKLVIFVHALEREISMAKGASVIIIRVTGMNGRMGHGATLILQPARMQENTHLKPNMNFLVMELVVWPVIWMYNMKKLRRNIVVTINMENTRRLQKHKMRVQQTTIVKGFLTRVAMVGKLTIFGFVQEMYYIAIVDSVAFIKEQDTYLQDTKSCVDRVETLMADKDGMINTTARKIPLPFARTSATPFPRVLLLR